MTANTTSQTTGAGETAAHEIINPHVRIYGAEIVKSGDSFGVLRAGSVKWCSSYGAAIMEAEKAPYDSWAGNPSPYWS
jgi:hypothetical protein